MKNRQRRFVASFWAFVDCAVVCRCNASAYAFGFRTAGGVAAQSAAGKNHPPATRQDWSRWGKNMGPEESSKAIAVTLWLQPHDRATFRQFGRAPRSKTSPNYHKWLKPSRSEGKFRADGRDDVNTATKQVPYRAQLEGSAGWSC